MDSLVHRVERIELVNSGLCSSFYPKSKGPTAPPLPIFHRRKHLSTQAAAISYSLADEGPIWFGHGGSVRWATPPRKAARRSSASSKRLATRSAAYCPEQS